jgi:hypothetical protein
MMLTNDSDPAREFQTFILTNGGAPGASEKNGPRRRVSSCEPTTFGAFSMASARLACAQRHWPGSGGSPITLPWQVGRSAKISGKNGENRLTFINDSLTRCIQGLRSRFGAGFTR